MNNKERTIGVKSGTFDKPLRISYDFSVDTLTVSSHPSGWFYIARISGRGSEIDSGDCGRLYIEGAYAS